MKKLLILLFTIAIIFPIIVNAKSCDENNMKITSIEIEKKSTNVEEISPAKTEGKNIIFDIRMKEINDQIKYKIVIENSSNEDYELKESDFDLKSEYFSNDFELEDGNNIVKSNSKKVAYYTIKYEKQVDYASLKDNYSLVLNLDLNQKDKIINPKTGIKALSVLLIIVSLLTTAIIIAKKRKKYLFAPLIILGIIMIPISIKALCNYNLKIESNIEVIKPGSDSIDPDNPDPGDTPISPTCFVSGTKVLTKDGNKNIEDIRIGDYVLSYNENNNTNEYKKVENTITSSTTEIYTIKTNNNSIKVTGSHYFYVVDNGYIEARYLKVGEQLLNSSGNPEIIRDIVKSVYDKKMSIYNLQVEDNHNFYVGNGILTHNIYLSKDGKLKLPLKVKNTSNHSTITLPITLIYDSTVNESKTFTFVIKPKDGAPALIGSTNGEYYFEMVGNPNRAVKQNIDIQIKFNEPGYYTYVIEIDENNTKGFTYDYKKYNLMVKVGENLKDVEAVVIIDDNYRKYDSIDFNISYDGPASP